MPLNEGWGSNPSDTGLRPGQHHRWGRRSTKAGVRTPATLPSKFWSSLVTLERSTKAGVRTPATPAAGVGDDPPAGAAQRRLGFEPQRHMRRRFPSGTGELAQRRLGFEPQRHPGVAGASVRSAMCPFAQRRLGFEPQRHRGDAWRVQGRPSPRSTKAGVRTPATRQYVGSAASLVPSAQRRLGFEPQRHAAATCSRGWAVRRSLNEGWGSNPSDTANPSRRGPIERIA